jgi:hypothetical protein
VTALYLVLWLFGWSTAQAGAPPSDVIPWDSVVVVDTVMVGGEPITYNHTVYFITRDKYERDLLGLNNVAELRTMKRDLEAVKAAIRAKKGDG